MKIAEARHSGLGKIVVDKCPYCGGTHYHNYPEAEGIREAECLRGEYKLDFSQEKNSERIYERRLCT